MLCLTWLFNFFELIVCVCIVNQVTLCCHNNQMVSLIVVDYTILVVASLVILFRSRIHLYEIQWLLVNNLFFSIFINGCDFL